MQRKSSFFQQHLRHIPALARQRWLLSVDGFVTQHLTVNYDTLRQLPHTSYTAAIACVGHTPEAPLLAEATWRGVPLAWVLDEVRPTAEAKFVCFYSADGYATSFAAGALADAMLAYEMDGEPLPREHGWPLRLIVPGRSGYKLPKWITRVVFSEAPVDGFWEQRGWHTEGIAPLLATVDAARVRATFGESVQLTGAAYGQREEMWVEVSIDGSAWTRVAAARPQASALLRWQVDWTPPAPGVYAVKARTRTSEAVQAEATQPTMLVEVTV